MYRPVMNTKEFNMNFIEKQTELGKSLYEINTSVMSHMTELSRKNIEQYFETTAHSARSCQRYVKLAPFSACSANMARPFGTMHAKPLKHRTRF